MYTSNGSSADSEKETGVETQNVQKGVPVGLMDVFISFTDEEQKRNPHYSEGDPHSRATAMGQQIEDQQHQCKEPATAEVQMGFTERGDTIGEIMFTSRSRIMTKAY